MSANKSGTDGEGINYVTLDVFTATKFAGNPLAIVEVPSSTNLTQDRKQTIAREFNYSETVFLHDSDGDTDRRIDIFTTTSELPFAGHPTIGTACHVFSRLARDGGGNNSTTKGTLTTKASPIAITYDVRAHVASASIPHNVHLHHTPFSPTDPLRLQPSLSHEDASTLPLGASNHRLHRQRHDLHPDLPAKRAAPVQISPTASLPTASLDEGWDKGFVGCYFYVRLPDSEDGSKNLRTRMMAGTLEDPATGSAAAALAAFLGMQEGKAGERVRYNVTQGVEMGRRSDIGVEVEVGEGMEVVDVRLVGGAVRVMEGRLC